MKKNNSIIFILCIFISNLFGQEELNTVPVITVNGPQGNYIYIMLEPSEIDKDEEFEIRRVSNFQIPFPDNFNENGDKIGTLKRIKNYKELSEFFSDSELEEMKQNFGGISDRELAQKFVDFKDPLDLSLYYGSVETQRALGFVFLDKDVQEGVNYYYQIHQKSAKKDEYRWSICRGGMGNYILPKLKPAWAGSEGRDSLVSMKWSLSLEQPQESFPIDQILSDDQYNQALFVLPFAYGNVTAKVFVENNGIWSESLSVYPDYIEDENKLEFTYRKNTIPETATRAYITLVDPVYNMGIPSDTALVFAVDSVFAPFIYDIEVTDTLNGIHISWDKLPNKPYYSGIEILKYNSDEELDTVAMLSPFETSFIDRKVEIGQYYRYQVKALFIPQKGLKQTIAAQSVGTYSKFTKPLPPTNLEGQTEGDFITLTWEYIDEPSIYGYYMYRGTSSKNLSLVAGPIKEKMWTDTLEALSGRTHYYYAVASQNYRQDTSAYSNIVSIRPDKQVEMTKPSAVNVYYVNGDIHLDWRDVRGGDNIIDGYVLQRKSNLEDTYSNLHDGILNKSTFVDKLTTEGRTYYYRVASVSMYGDQSEFSDGTMYEVQKEKIATINEFSVRNVSDGVKISLPQMEFENRKSYNLYRRPVTQREFSKLTTFPASQFSYTDTDVISNNQYVYKITVTENDDREGPKGKGITVRVR